MPQWRAARAGGSCCESRTSTRPVAVPNTRRPYSRTCTGWGSPGRSRCDANPNTSHAYADALARLTARGLIYPSFESRAEIARLVAERDRGSPWPRDPDGVPLYPGTAKSLAPAERARRMASGEPYALRLDMAAALDAAGADLPIAWTETGAGPRGETGRVAADPGEWGDVVLGRKDTPTSYHLSVVVDDALQGITHVVRGRDLFPATGLHRLLQILLELPEPIYHHHRLILDAEGRKLSKSTCATGLRELRAGGAAPADILAMIGIG